jgi:Na+/melibiose symporter-like transporter
MLSLGGVVVTVASTAVLNATTTVVAGAPQNSATGVYLYVLIAGVLFAVATVTAWVLVQKRFAPPQEPGRRGRHARV